MDVLLGLISACVLVGGLLVILVPGFSAASKGKFSEYKVPIRSWIIFGVSLAVTGALIIGTLLN